MQDETENAEVTEKVEESPLSSEAPDSVAGPLEEPTVATEDPQALIEATDSPEPVSITEGHAAEPPDGELQETAEDLLADANAVDPKIDIGLLEAYLFSTHSPLTPGRLAELFNLESTKPIRKAIRLLNEQYEQTRRCFRVEQVAGGFQLLTLADYGEPLKALHQREQDAKLTKAALETLAIIAYKQPILRADLEAIRGVASGETIRSLMEKHLVKIAGRAEEPGRPILYGTTKRFLEVFGMNSLKDLPQPDSPQAKSRAAQVLLADEPAEQPPREQTTSAAGTDAEAPAAQEIPAEQSLAAPAESVPEQPAGETITEGPAAEIPAADTVAQEPSTPIEQVEQPQEPNAPAEDEGKPNP